MSRSYKKNPVVSDYSKNTTKYNNRLANKRFRKNIALEKDTLRKPKYKHYSQSYNIFDYKIRMSKEEAVIWYNEGAAPDIKKYYPTLESWLNYWEKCYRRK